MWSRPMMHGGLLTEDAKLRERAVGDRELARLLAGEDVAQRSVALSSLLDVHHRVPVAEGAALAILPTQAHMVPCNGRRWGLLTPTTTTAFTIYSF